MPTEEIINEVHALVAASIKLEQDRCVAVMDRLVLAAKNAETKRLLIQGIAEIKGEK